MVGKWRLERWDTFSLETYPLEGEFNTEKETQDAARLHLAQLEMTQPSEDTGGQEEDGIQDQVYIVRPDGTKYRFVEAMTHD